MKALRAMAEPSNEHGYTASLSGNEGKQGTRGVPLSPSESEDETEHLFDYNGADLRTLVNPDAVVVCQSRDREGLKEIPSDGKHPDL
jgi:hypothetical protein